MVNKDVASKLPDVNKMVDRTKPFLIRLLRNQAYDYSTAAAPQVSPEAIALNKCADELERLSKKRVQTPDSVYDRLMK